MSLSRWENRKRSRNEEPGRRLAVRGGRYASRPDGDALKSRRREGAREICELRIKVLGNSKRPLPVDGRRWSKDGALIHRYRNRDRYRNRFGSAKRRQAARRKAGSFLPAQGEEPGRTKCASFIAYSRSEFSGSQRNLETSALEHQNSKQQRPKPGKHLYRRHRTSSEGSTAGPAGLLPLGRLDLCSYLFCFASIRVASRTKCFLFSAPLAA